MVTSSKDISMSTTESVSEVAMETTDIGITSSAIPTQPKMNPDVNTGLCV